MMTAILLMACTETNPGPGIECGRFCARLIANRRLSEVHLGLLNVGGATSNVGAMDDLIRDHWRDTLAVCESWLPKNAPDTIEYDIAPENYWALHAHRQRLTEKGQCRRGAGLAFICSNQLSAMPLKCSRAPETFELQLVVLQVDNITVKVANIIDHLGCRKSTCQTSSLFCSRRYAAAPVRGSSLAVAWTCQCPIPAAIRNGSSLYWTCMGISDMWCSQRDAILGSSHCDVSLLDLVITLTSPAVSNHDLVVCYLSIRRHKPPSTRHWYRDIKFNVAEFEGRLRSSKLFTDSADSPDAYLRNSLITIERLRQCWPKSPLWRLTADQMAGEELGGWTATLSPPNSGYVV